MTISDALRFIGTFAVVAITAAALVRAVWPPRGELSQYRKREIANRPSNVTPIRRQRQPRN